MAHIDIVRDHNLGVREARSRFVPWEQKLVSSYRVKFDWSGDRAKMSGPGLNGEIWFDDQRIGITLTLGLILRPVMTPLRHAIEEGIEETVRGPAASRG
jgi:putative polyhydroxyalkanoate system protein